MSQIEAQSTSSSLASNKPNGFQPISEAALHAQLIISGDFASSAIVSSYLETTSTDPRTILKALQEQAKEVHVGDMRQVESMLMGQAVALQSMFADFALRAKRAQSPQAVQYLAQLALRSQASSRSTLQTLADVKNPKQVAFVKQTNVAQNQQVNNGVPPIALAGVTEKSPNKLVEREVHGCTEMDARTETAASRANPGVVAVDPVYRARN